MFVMNEKDMLKVLRYQVGKARHAANTFTVYTDKDPKSYRFYLQEFNENNDQYRE